MTIQEQIEKEMEQWAMLRRAMADETHVSASIEPTLRMQRTENLLLASASLRRLSQKVRRHAQILRETSASYKF